ncbi:flagellin N-terminal helical domain-containing protein [Oceanospirillum sediminis]|uniref:Flagellin n=1 Tax=Oceanospirillum sediminis TaxID=2760088 RepID=A0A839IJX4_9GAMM|nr:flagellin [Oceanospirillum sediminis]MBB1485643.1 flagellin [Oceanospirillum sediminis]
MAMYVNTNVSSLNGQRNLSNVTERMNSSFEKLSSGSRINSARDDAAGLQIADRLTTQLTGLNQGNRNANDGISIAQIAEGAISEITNNVQRMRQLAVQGGNRTLSTDDRDALGQEFKKLLDTNDDIAERTAYGTIKLLNYDSSSAGFQIQSGAQAGEQDTVTTGNAKLTSMFGEIVAAEVKAGTVATGLNVSAMSGNALSSMGTLGKVIGAYMMATNETSQQVAVDALLGANTNTAAVGKGLTLSQMGNLSTIQINAEEFTKVLTATISGDGGSVKTSALVQAVGSNLLGIAAADVIESITGGFSDTNLNDIHGFMTDALLDGMSSLVSQADKQRAKLGAEQNGLMSTVRSNTAAVVNVSDSRARITDTDFATETAELTRNQIIQQAATSILSQANQLPNAALSLLR